MMFPMKATVLMEAPVSHAPVPRDVLTTMRAFQESVAARSAIIWAEHCSECAFPACYTQCTFYTPRADLDCRRFEAGIEAVADGGDLGLMRIQFRRWGKLEGGGALALWPPDVVRAREKRDAWVSARLAKPVLPRSLARRLVWSWNSQKRAASSRAMRTPDAQAFVIETYLAPEGAVSFTLTITPTDKSVDGLFQARFDVASGYSRALFPVADIARTVDLTGPFLAQIEPVGDPPAQPVVFGLADFVAFRKDSAPAPSHSAQREPAKKHSKTAKCLVFDLDGTLWSGTLAEDGLEGLALRPGVVELIQALDARGILLSVASKNDPEPALAALDAFGLREYFLFPQIGWEPKSDSLRRIAELIDIGLDTFVFIDDQPFERAEVMRGAPSVTTMDAELIPQLLQHPLLDVPATPEAARRRLMYKTEETRQSVFNASGADYLDFLRDCQIELRISPLTAHNLERIFELTQRTNQLNFSGARYSRDELSSMISDPERSFVLSCADKFGDYGVIGFVVTSREHTTVESFFMSCRVQRKRVENAFFEHLALLWGRPETLRVRFRPTPKNAASVRVLEALGFTRSGDGFERNGALNFPESDIVRISLSQPIPAPDLALPAT
jgi:FkbH-like protein